MSTNAVSFLAARSPARDVHAGRSAHPEPQREGIKIVQTGRHSEWRFQVNGGLPPPSDLLICESVGAEFVQSTFLRQFGGINWLQVFVVAILVQRKGVDHPLHVLFPNCGIEIGRMGRQIHRRFIFLQVGQEGGGELEFAAFDVDLDQVDLADLGVLEVRTPRELDHVETELVRAAAQEARIAVTELVAHAVHALNAVFIRQRHAEGGDVLHVVELDIEAEMTVRNRVRFKRDDSLEFLRGVKDGGSDPGPHVEVGMIRVREVGEDAERFFFPAAFGSGDPELVVVGVHLEIDPVDLNAAVPTHAIVVFPRPLDHLFNANNRLLF